MKGKSADSFSNIMFMHPYLVHTNRNIIQAQGCAWFDTAGVCMSVDLLLKLWPDKQCCKTLSPNMTCDRLPAGDLDGLGCEWAVHWVKSLMHKLRVQQLKTT